MKLSEIVQTRPLIEKIAAKEMNTNTGEAIAFARFSVKVLKAIQEFDQKRAELFRKLGQEEGEGADVRISILPENEKKFNNAIKRLLSKELDIEPFDISSLNITIAPVDLINALPLFKSI